MAHRFFIAPADWDPSAPQLTGAEAHHAISVLRLREGDVARVFDGLGSEQSVKVGAIGRDRVEFVPGAVDRTRPLPCRIALAQAIPKGKNMELVLQKATELGVAAIFPLETERTVVRVGQGEAAAKREKWQRVAIEACKQCGQNFLPEVAAPVSWAEHLATRAPEFELLLIASLEPGARHLKSILGDFRQEHGRDVRSVMLLIGPEGDFTGEEVALALAAGARPMTLGPIILRTETAAIYGLSVLAHELQSAG